MKEHKKKILIIVVGILLIIGIGIGVSYAWWTHTISQEGINTIQSTCLEIALEDENSITLEKAYPITDEEAEKLPPYTFTITNKCPTMIEYDVNLDIMESSSRLSSSYVAIEFNGNEKKLLSTLESVETSYPGVDYVPVEGRYITSGELGANESKTYTIKLWMDESVTVEDDAMNKSFISKVVVTAKQSHKVRLVDYVINKNEAEEFKHEATEQTPALTDYRYTGKNPNNWVYFGCDTNCTDDNLYRIIGVIPTQSEIGKDKPYENRVKLIHYYEYVGDAADMFPIMYGSTPSNKAYRWNSENNNNWEESTTQKNILNNKFYNNLGEYKNYIATSVWYLGALDYTKWDNNIYTPNMLYKEERGAMHSQNNGALSFSANIGLMYASDVAYIMGNQVVDKNPIVNAFSNNWLYVYRNAEWGISPYLNTNQSAGQFGGIYFHYTDASNIFSHIASLIFPFSIRPTFYLKSNVLYENGDGSQENPYRISNNE